MPPLFNVWREGDTMPATVRAGTAAQALDLFAQREGFQDYAAFQATHGDLRARRVPPGERRVSRSQARHQHRRDVVAGCDMALRGAGIPTYSEVVISFAKSLDGLGREQALVMVRQLLAYV